MGSKGPQALRNISAAYLPWVTHSLSSSPPPHGPPLRRYDETMFKQHTSYCTSGSLTAMSPDCVMYRTQGSEGYCSYTHIYKSAHHLSNSSSHSVRQRGEICRSSALVTTRSHIQWLAYTTTLARNRMWIGLCAAAHGPQRIT